MTTATKSIEMSADQRQAHDAVVEWVKAGKTKLLTLGGYAGVGKTTIIGEIMRTLRAQKPKDKRRPFAVGFCAFTGKASLVLRTKLEAAGVLGQDFFGTIHSMIYEPVTQGGLVIGWRKRDKADVALDLIILDEASMIDEVLFKDLQSYVIPILAVGDHGQLPPVKGTLNLMENPQIKLEKIHRQAEGNPIIKLATLVRETGKIPVGKYGEFVNKVRDRAIIERILNPSEMLILCGTNRTRVSVNALIRQRLGFTSPEPEDGEKVICLRNNRDANIYNGMQGVIRSIQPDGDHWYKAEIDMDGTGVRFKDRICKHQFGEPKTIQEVPNLHPKAIGDRFDFGYCITVHKAQGSEHGRVVVIDECDWMESDDMKRRWRYTAITRSSERLLVIGD